MQQYVLNKFQNFFLDEVSILRVTSSFPKVVPKKNIFPFLLSCAKIIFYFFGTGDLKKGRGYFFWETCISVKI